MYLNNTGFDYFSCKWEASFCLSLLVTLTAFHLSCFFFWWGGWLFYLLFQAWLKSAFKCEKGEPNAYDIVTSVREFVLCMQLEFVGWYHHTTCPNKSESWSWVSIYRDPSNMANVYTERCTLIESALIEYNNLQEICTSTFRLIHN